MKTNELRIGNLVLRKSDMFQSEIHSIYTSSVKLWCNPLAFFHETEIEPIPLTEEILIKCGFEKSDYPNYKFKVSALTLTCRIQIGINYSEFGGIYFGDKFKYLHQLQNFIFLVSGQELKIEL